MVFGANTENNPRCDIIQLAQKPYSKPDFENIMVFGAKMAKISWFLAQNIMVFGAGCFCNTLHINNLQCRKIPINILIKF